MFKLPRSTLIRLSLIKRVNNGTQLVYASSSAHIDVRGNHSQIATTNGAASLVLLKNTDDALPLNKPLPIILFSTNAGQVMAGTYS